MTSVGRGRQASSRLGATPKKNQRSSSAPPSLSGRLTTSPTPPSARRIHEKILGGLTESLKEEIPEITSNVYVSKTYQLEEETPDSAEEAQRSIPFPYTDSHVSSFNMSDYFGLTERSLGEEAAIHTLLRTSPSQNVESNFQVYKDASFYNQFNDIEKSTFLFEAASPSDISEKEGGVTQRKVRVKTQELGDGAKLISLTYQAVNGGGKGGQSQNPIHKIIHVGKDGKELRCSVYQYREGRWEKFESGEQTIDQVDINNINKAANLDLTQNALDARRLKGEVEEYMGGSSPFDPNTLYAGAMERLEAYGKKLPCEDNGYASPFDPEYVQLHLTLANLEALESQTTESPIAKEVEPLFKGEQSTGYLWQETLKKTQSCIDAFQEAMKKCQMLLENKHKLSTPEVDSETIEITLEDLKNLEARANLQATKRAVLFGVGGELNLRDALKQYNSELENIPKEIKEYSDKLDGLLKLNGLSTLSSQDIIIPTPESKKEVAPPSPSTSGEVDVVVDSEKEAANEPKPQVSSTAQATERSFKDGETQTESASVQKEVQAELSPINTPNAPVVWDLEKSIRNFGTALLKLKAVESRSLSQLEEGIKEFERNLNEDATKIKTLERGIEEVQDPKQREEMNADLKLINEKIQEVEEKLKWLKGERLEHENRKKKREEFEKKFKALGNKLASYKNAGKPLDQEIEDEFRKLVRLEQELNIIFRAELRPLGFPVKPKQT